MLNFDIEPVQVREIDGKKVFEFKTSENANIDPEVVKSFGEEWSKFYRFSQYDIQQVGETYFDIIEKKHVDSNSIVLDIGCGTGRWSNYLADNVKFVDAIDPSDAVYVAARLNRNIDNIRISKASTDNIPFKDNAFDFILSLGVLHHIPNTEKALRNVHSKLKVGRYFLGYLYYNFENRGFLYRVIFNCSDLLRKLIAPMPYNLKKIVCDFLAFTLYCPLIGISKLFKLIFPNSQFYKKIPLSYYSDKSLFIIRNDALDRFGTKIEKRYSKEDIRKLLTNCGFEEIYFSETEPYWHFIAKKV